MKRKSWGMGVRFGAFMLHPPCIHRKIRVSNPMRARRSRCGPADHAGRIAAKNPIERLPVIGEKSDHRFPRLVIVRHALPEIVEWERGPPFVQSPAFTDVARAQQVNYLLGARERPGAIYAGLGCDRSHESDRQHGGCGSGFESSTSF
jgi:hypothetical protein